MKKSLFALLALSSNVFAGASFEDYIKAVKASRPYDTKKISNVGLLTVDMVIHYEQAVVLGTTADYEERAKIQHFDSFLNAADNMCGEIDLAGCIYDLVCEDKIIHNLNKTIMPCKN
jgi:hypothetical protein